MKLYELYYVEQQLDEAFLDFVPGPLRKAVSGIFAAAVIMGGSGMMDGSQASSPAKPTSEPALRAQAQHAAEQVRTMTPDQYQDLVASMKSLEGKRNLLGPNSTTDISTIVKRMERSTPEQFADELEHFNKNWIAHHIDDQQILLRGEQLRKADMAIEYLVKKGLKRSAAIALVGGFIQESGLDETKVNPHGGAYGIAQWMGERKKGVPKDFIGQLDYVWKELQGSENTTFKMLQNANTPGQLVYAANRYERFKGWKQGGRGDLSNTEHGRRTEYTKILAQRFGEDDKLAQKMAVATL